MYKRIDRKHGLLSFVLILGSTGACSSDDAASGTPTMARNAGKVDACAVLEAADPESLLGEPTGGATLLWDSHSADVSISHCQFVGRESGHTMGLLLRWSADGGVPTGKAAVIDEVRAGDAMGSGAETAAALEAGTELAGIGDLALAYSLFGENVMLWKGRYQATITVSGYNSGGNAEDTAAAAARSIATAL